MLCPDQTAQSALEDWDFVNAYTARDGKKPLMKSQHWSPGRFSVHRTDAQRDCDRPLAGGTAGLQYFPGVAYSLRDLEQQCQRLFLEGVMNAAVCSSQFPALNEPHRRTPVCFPDASPNMIFEFGGGHVFVMYHGQKNAKSGKLLN